MRVAQLYDSEEVLYLLKQLRDFGSIVFYRRVAHRVVVVEVGQKSEFIMRILHIFGHE